MLSEFLVDLSTSLHMPSAVSKMRPTNFQPHRIIKMEAEVQVRGFVPQYFLNPTLMK